MFDKPYFNHIPFDWTVYVPPPPLITRILHVKHPALLTVTQKRAGQVIKEYDNLSSLDDEYLTGQVGLDVAAGDSVKVTTLPGIEYTYQVAS